MNVLIVKLNATGDVVRTTTLLHRFDGEVTWITAAMNRELLDGLRPGLRCLTWDDRGAANDRRYDLVINLEDEQETAAFVRDIPHAQRFGAFLNGDGTVTYTDDSRKWFDLSLISVYGRRRADELKLQNRRTYQDLIFEGLGFRFQGERYWLPRAVPTGLTGDVAIASVAGPVWPMKAWDYYDELKARLESEGLRVNVLPRRPTLLEHMGDIQSHRCLVGGDSLPMHLALATNTPCVTLFSCTSPWEIYDYGLQTQIVSPLLERFFYQRGLDRAATSAITLESVYDAVMVRLAAPATLRAPSVRT
ncbi:MAG TPA: glycosyltransferase family 9 protein [Vicinamibacterales bacterium]|jgi:lipopolysaccharide heptosyltransferase II|nr:glycosyltransferase family 9 protein [Vicinamibacterales bacterium]